jgi:hypothetical protein
MIRKDIYQNLAGEKPTRKLGGSTFRDLWTNDDGFEY